MPREAGALSKSSRLPGAAVLFRRVGSHRLHGLVDLGRLPPSSRCVNKTLSRSGIKHSFSLFFVVGRSFQTPTCATIPLDHTVPPSELSKKAVASISGATGTESVE
jgi:hypothetical protein